MTRSTFPIVARFSDHVSLTVFHRTMVPSPSFQYWVGLVPIHNSPPTAPIPCTTEDIPSLSPASKVDRLELLLRWIRNI